ncbi:hypothetical protein AGATL06_13150 [Agathobaculum sp. TL06]
MLYRQIAGDARELSRWAQYAALPYSNVFPMLYPVSVFSARDALSACARTLWAARLRRQIEYVQQIETMVKNNA